jgi:hypothetical protein
MTDKFCKTDSLHVRIIGTLLGVTLAYINIGEAHYKGDIYYLIGCAWFLIGLSAGFPLLKENFYYNLLNLVVAAIIIYSASAELSWLSFSLLILGYLAVVYYLLWHRRKKLKESIKSGDKS